MLDLDTGGHLRVDLMSLFRQLHGAPPQRGYPAAERSAPYAGPPTQPPAGARAPGFGGGGGEADPGMFWMFDNPQVPPAGGGAPAQARAAVPGGMPGGAAGVGGAAFGGALGG